ncbi:alpha/beta fold hydrolase [Glaciihabitans sp. UYNi722]|uniref:alpha/beta hydrolase n=1 Tax=Glaciihabitans sp. UYNi722 TaxID=3156344 RepID=UPI003396942B
MADLVGDDHPMFVLSSLALHSDSPGRVVLVHGGAHTGSTWLKRPDGSPGWAQYFTAQGWSVDVVDWPGVGRSQLSDTFEDLGPAIIVDALRQLIDEVQPTVVIGHSIGATLLAKAVETISSPPDALIFLSPAPLGNSAGERQIVPLDRSFIYSPERATAVFTTSARFPKNHRRNYLRSLVGTSPSVMNALSNGDGLGTLLISDLERLRLIPSLVIVGGDDMLTIPPATATFARIVGAEHVELESDWNLAGFGHMIPIENGSDAVLERILNWINKKLFS